MKIKRENPSTLRKQKNPDEKKNKSTWVIELAKFIQVELWHKAMPFAICSARLAIRRFYSPLKVMPKFFPKFTVFAALEVGEKKLLGSFQSMGVPKGDVWTTSTFFWGLGNAILSFTILSFTYWVQLKIKLRNYNYGLGFGLFFFFFLNSIGLKEGRRYIAIQADTILKRSAHVFVVFQPIGITR